MSAKQAINDKLQGSTCIATLQSYKQERDCIHCIVHFLRLLPVCWPGAQSARDNHVHACKFAKYSPIYFFTHRLSNNPFLIWLSTTPPHLKYVATLPCNVSLIACFPTFIFHKVV